MKKVALVVLLLLSCFLLEARLPDLIPFRKGNLWGYSDSTKKTIIEPQYESAEFFAFGRAVVKKNGKFGVIDVQGKTVLRLVYKEIKAGPISGYWKAILLGDKCGIVDSNDKLCVPGIYDRIDWCGGEFICTGSDAERKIMNLHHQQVAVYSAASSDQGPEYVPASRCFIVQSFGHFGVIDVQGKLRLDSVYDKISVTSCGYFIAERNGTCAYYSAKLKRKKRLPKKSFDSKANSGSLVLPGCTKIYERSTDFIGAVLDSSNYTLSWGWQYEDGSTWAMMPKYDTAGSFSYGLATFGRDGKLGVVDSLFIEVIAPKYELIFPVRPGFVMIMRKPRVDFAKHPNLRLFMGYVDIHGTEYWED